MTTVAKNQKKLRPLAPNVELYRMACKAGSYFEKGSYKSAVVEYSKILKLAKDEETSFQSEIYDDFTAMIMSNRSASYFLLESYVLAQKDAELVCKMRPFWAKGHFRKAQALSSLKLFNDALLSYKEAVKLDPKNSEFKKRLLSTYLDKENYEKGFSILQLLPGRDFALPKNFGFIQNKINQFAIEMKNFIYIIVDLATHNCIIIDACWDTEGIMKIVKKNKLIVVGLIVTHYHFDHVGGIPPAPFDQLKIKVNGLSVLLRKLNDVKAYIHEADIPYVKMSNPCLLEDKIEKCYDGMCIKIGMNLNIKFIHTPGHSLGSQCILLNDNRLFSGDTLFIGNCGRLDLPGSSKQQMFNSLHKKLAILPDDVVVYPGHFYGGEWTTIYEEKNFGALKNNNYHKWLFEKLDK